MAPQRQKSRPEVVKANGKGEPILATASGMTPSINWAAFLAGNSRGKTILEYSVDRTIFVQGDPADSVWFLEHGQVKLAVTSQQGKEAIVSVLGDNEFFGEGMPGRSAPAHLDGHRGERLHSLPDGENADGASAPRAVPNIGTVHNAPPDTQHAI